MDDRIRKSEDCWIDERGRIHYQAVEDHTPIVQDNWYRQNYERERKGFTNERTMQHVAQVPASVHHRWAKKVGYYDMDRDQKRAAMMRFLNEHPEYRTVERLKTDTPNSGHIIVVSR